MPAVRLLAGVQNASGIDLYGVAAAAAINQIVVIADTLGCFRPRLQMFDAEGIFAHRMPPLAPQTVNAAKLVFIPQPWLIRLVVQIPQRAVTADVYQQRILEGQPDDIKELRHQELPPPPFPSR